MAVNFGSEPSVLANRLMLRTQCWRQQAIDKCTDKCIGNSLSARYRFCIGALQSDKITCPDLYTCCRRRGDFASRAYFYDRRRLHKVHKTNANPSAQTQQRPKPNAGFSRPETIRNIHVGFIRVCVRTTRCAWYKTYHNRITMNKKERERGRPTARKR